MPILADSNRLVRAESEDWRNILKTAVRTPQELAARLSLPLDAICGDQAGGNFPLFVPEPFLGRMTIGDLNDPLLRQVLPVAAENKRAADFSDDPLNEASSIARPGLLHKYRGRALLVLNGSCAVHCRYCFRRHFPYESSGVKDHWKSSLDSIRADSSIREIILSGGDPLTLVDEQLAWLVRQCESIGHVKQLRIHTRLPIVIPPRVTCRLLEILSASRLAPIIVVHANHARELDNQVQESMGQLRNNKLILLNQAVLLKGVNDSLESQIALSHRLIEIGVLPYYLHQLDRVHGASHFEVPLATGIELIQQMRARLPGYLVPRFVREVPGEPGKTVLA